MLSVIMDKGPIYICCNIFFFQLYITLVALSTFVFPALIIAICYIIILFVIMGKGPIYICCNIFFFQLYITLVALSTFVFPALIIAICYTIILLGPNLYMLQYFFLSALHHAGGAFNVCFPCPHYRHLLYNHTVCDMG